MLALGRRTELVPAPDTIRYLRSVITAEGLIARFAPDFDVGAYLEQVCEDELREQEWSDWFSPATMAEWAAGAAKLLGLAPSALANRLRPSDENRPTNNTSDGGNDAREVLQWGLLTLGAAAAAVFGGGEITLGVNLFTAGAVSSAAAATMFLRTVRHIR
jgi:hypothetical protein